MPTYPTDVGNALSHAYASFESGDFGTVMEVCRNILHCHPDNFDGLYLAGLAMWRAGDPVGGERLIDKACKTLPDIEEFGLMLPQLKREPNVDGFTFRFERLRLYKHTSALQGVVISFPKCGRTWVRAFLGHYLLHRRPGNPLEVAEITLTTPGLPFTDFSHDDYPHWKPAKELVRNKRMYAGTRVAFLVRDPRDVLVSYYFQYTKRGDRDRALDSSFDGSLSDFVRHPIGGLSSIVSFYNIWAAAREEPRAFELFTYEEITENPESEFRRLIGFLGLPDHGDKAVAESMDFSSFNNMRKMEETNALNSERLRPPANGDREGFKVRRGKVGGHREYLTPKDIAYIDTYINENLDDFFDCYKC